MTNLSHEKARLEKEVSTSVLHVMIRKSNRVCRLIYFYFLFTFLSHQAKKKAGSTKKISLAANKKVVNSSSLLDEYANDDYDDYDDGIDFMW